MDKDNPGKEQPGGTGLAEHGDLRDAEVEQPTDSTCLVDKASPETEWHPRVTQHRDGKGNGGTNGASPGTEWHPRATQQQGDKGNEGTGEASPGKKWHPGAAQ